MQRLAKLSGAENEACGSSREGIKIIMSNGSITVIPKKLYGFKVISEARSMEAAKELCESAEEYLK